MHIYMYFLFLSFLLLCVCLCVINSGPFSERNNKGYFISLKGNRREQSFLLRFADTTRLDTKQTGAKLLKVKQSALLALLAS